MGKFAVIGLGNFGSNVARVLFDLGHEVICLDRNETLVNTAQGFTTYGLVGKATDSKLLSSMNVDQLDAVFVSLGHNMADSILVTLHLKDLEAKRIVVKITSEDHGRILMKVGANEVVFPERDMAVQVATYVSSPSIMSYLELSPEYSVQEIVPGKSFMGKTLAETGIRRDYGANVIGIRDVLMDKIHLNPLADYVIKDSDILIVIGRREELAELSKKE